ncbi:Six-hairpin glycosidase-like protein [Aspergillus unguis]
MFTFYICILLAAQALCISPAQRRSIVRSFSPRRNASSTTPLQVGNGNFAFGADITGLQTFRPFAIMSSWAWHNFSLPATSKIEDFTGQDWWTHDRLVNYNMPNPAKEDISTWLIQNPQRMNMANIGLYFQENITEDQLLHKSQTLDLWDGTILSTFQYNSSRVQVQVRSHPSDPAVAIEVKSDLLSKGLGVFFDFPYPTTNKFDAPYVGVWNEMERNSVDLQTSNNTALFKHITDQNINHVSVRWSAGSISGPLSGTNRYILDPTSDTLQIVAVFDSTRPMPTYHDICTQSASWWNEYWTSGAFVDLSATRNSTALELQRRIILSQYVAAVNQASDTPPQESGLVNNGWYGKFHLEMIPWHTLHFARWNHHDLLARSIPGTYQRFLNSSIIRASNQGYNGARWGKMTDPTGRSAPGEINALLIWQQPHPMLFAETIYHHFQNTQTLREWDQVITATADFMASYAWWNTSTQVYDLGPPMYPVSENTHPNKTINPTFELAYWRFGLDIAIQWKQRQGLTVPHDWINVRDNLAPLPIIDDAYAVYEGIPDMWNGTTVQDHPAMAGIYGFLPPTYNLNMTVMHNTADLIHEKWDLQGCYGWDFSMLAMNSLRLGDTERALSYLLHEYYAFDDAGYPVGGERVPTPYFPNTGGLLLAVAMMAGGWDGEGLHFPTDWSVDVDGFSPIYKTMKDEMVG